MDLLEATFGMLLAPLAHEGQSISIVPDLLGAHMNVGGVTVARLLGGMDGVHAYDVGGLAIADVHADAAGHLHAVDGHGVPLFESSSIGHDAAFHDAFSASLGGAHENALGVMQLHDSAGIAHEDIHHAVLDHFGGVHDGIHDLHHGFADLHQSAFDLLDVHHQALSSLQELDFGAIADHLHDVIDPDIFF